MTVRGKNLYLKKNNKNKKIIVSTIIVAILVIIISSYSFALWSATEQQEGFNQVNIGCLDLVVNDNKPINLVNAYQLTDQEALEQVPYSFKITNNCSEDEYVSIQLDMKSSNTLSTNNLRLSLISDNDYIVWPSQISELSDSNEINIDGYTTAKKLKIEKIDGNATKEYNLYLWIDEDTPYEDINNKTFESKIEIVNVEAPENTNPTKWHITYDLDGGVLTKINRDEYDENDYTFTLSTPTKEGYTFAGWSGGKNLFDIASYNTTSEVIFGSNSMIFDASSENENIVGSIYLNKYLANSVVDIICYNSELKRHSCYFQKDFSFDSIKIKLNGRNKDAGFFVYLDNLIDENIYNVSYNIDYISKTESKALISYLQLEEGTEATAYEPYINKQVSVIIPQGSTGNRTYIANWISNE
ncbi:MAG: InlB B-repeat-containing protein [Bacilli bacterium]|nr:InlB B-repeat-containing protein [Bacilli bacterium]